MQARSSTVCSVSGECAMRIITTLLLTRDQFPMGNLAGKEFEAQTLDGIRWNVADVLFHDGVAGDTAYLIKWREVEIMHNVGREERVLVGLGQGETFGEMSLIDNQSRIAKREIRRMRKW